MKEKFVILCLTESAWYAGDDVVDEDVSPDFQGEIELAIQFDTYEQAREFMITLGQKHKGIYQIDKITIF